MTQDEIRERFLAILQGADDVPEAERRFNQMIVTAVFGNRFGPLPTILADAPTPTPRKRRERLTPTTAEQARRQSRAADARRRRAERKLRELDARVQSGELVPKAIAIDLIEARLVAFAAKIRQGGREALRLREAGADDDTIAAVIDRTGRDAIRELERPPFPKP